MKFVDEYRDVPSTSISRRCVICIMEEETPFD